tara:strand:+ start:293 stop:568 length:276 start_codon:yes stop_codon:yes gene_type:complete
VLRVLVRLALTATLLLLLLSLLLLLPLLLPLGIIHLPRHHKGKGLGPRPNLRVGGVLVGIAGVLVADCAPVRIAGEGRGQEGRAVADPQAT